jgi:uncharacterized protein
MQDEKAWSPYLAGALSGIVSILSVWIAGQYFGASTTFVRLAGAIEGLFAPERVAQLEYFVRVAPRIDWQMMFVVGILAGSFIAAKTSGTFKMQWVPDMWHRKFGFSPVKRGVMAFFGGAVAMFGARMADG